MDSPGEPRAEQEQKAPASRRPAQPVAPAPQAPDPAATAIPAIPPAPPEAHLSVLVARSFAALTTGALLGSFLGLSASPIISTFVAAISALLATFLGLQPRLALDRKKDEGAALLDRKKDDTSSASKEGDADPPPRTPREVSAPERPDAHVEVVRSVSVGLFALACLTSALLAVRARSNGWLAPTFKMRVQSLMDAGFPADEARFYVTYQDLGIQLPRAAAPAETRPEAAAPSGKPATAESSAAPAAAAEGPEKKPAKKEEAATAVRMPPPGVLSAAGAKSCAELRTKQFTDPDVALRTYRTEGPPFDKIADEAAKAPPDKQLDVLKALTARACSGAGHP